MFEALVALKREHLTRHAVMLISPGRERLKKPHSSLSQLEIAPLFLRCAALIEPFSGCSAVRFLNYMVLWLLNWLPPASHCCRNGCCAAGYFCWRIRP